MGRHDERTQAQRRQHRRSAVASSPLAALSMCAVILTGQLVPGVECPALQTDEGETIALSHIPGTFAFGDRVTVTGSGYGGSMSCQQEVLLVTTVEAAE
ncbi:DUF5818 domain-containing protein [Salipiger abyssi]|uniref:DUF5818 domain-containing protein n=1 Tax=Salipiger abyssi TaxID=1250539 RepID=UPI001A8E5DB6|nr:DUF5818 domain-containing protein [Salipiger abyssi]MBN9889836.1 hypothetical protein [Salipiger abyssi]